MPTIKSYNKRLEALRTERSSFINVWRELSDYHLAHRGRFLVTDRNKGHKRNTRQYNNTSRMACRTLASGMMAGITSPARPWFKLQAGDKELSEYPSVKEWLHDVQTIMYKVFSQSNFYNAIHNVYSELGVFGTAPMGVFRDFENVIRCKPYTCGSYMLALNGVDIVDTFYREYELPVAQIVKRFGIDNVSNHVKQMWDSGNTETAVKIIHCVEPNDDRDQQSPLARDKAFRSVYYEYDSGKRGNEQFLRQSGFDDFPIMAPRWEVTGEDVYAVDCPGMTALGDTKALQLGEKKKYKALDMIVDPPMFGDISLRSTVSPGGLRPGETVWGDTKGAGLSSVYGNYRPDLNAMIALNQESEMRIKRAFYEDLFLMLAHSDRRQITAREVAEKHEEKLLMLGPVLERLHSELLDPAIDRTFNILQASGVLPPPPPELQERELNVEYVSVLAQAQRMVAVGGLERLTGYVADVSQIWPEARHKIDPMQAVDDYAESIGVSPSVIRTDQDAEEAAAAEAQAAQQAAMQESMAASADIAKTASETQMTEDNALNNMLRNAGLQ